MILMGVQTILDKLSTKMLTAYLLQRSASHDRITSVTSIISIGIEVTANQRCLIIDTTPQK